MMGRLLYELGQVEEKKHNANERNANKTGKASFSWAWEMDSGAEERERSARNANISISNSDPAAEASRSTLLNPAFPYHRRHSPFSTHQATKILCPT